MTSPIAWPAHLRFPSWLKTAVVAAAVAIITVQWVNTRIAILRTNQFVAEPVLPTTYVIYHSMATGFSEGRIGQVDLAALRDYANLHNPWAPFAKRMPDAAPQWVSYYTLDVGYSFIVEAARLMFPALPDNHLRALALQLVVDALLVGFVFHVFARWSTALGLLAALLYCSNQVFSDLVSFPFYYYWDIPLTFVVLGSLLLAFREPARATGWLTLMAGTIGFGVWLRGSWWPIGLFLLGVTLFTPGLRRHLVVPLVLFCVIAAPQVGRASYARGHLTLSTRSVWHVALVGLGYYPNPYGLQAQDAVIFKLTKDKYGVEFRSEDYEVHDQAARREYLAIWKKDPGFVIRSFSGRLGESIAGRTQTSVRAYRFVTNVQYLILCVTGFVVMVMQGGERRLLAIAAAGTYVIYVVLTCVFYFVGLAYDNVSQVTLFVLMMGGCDAAGSLLSSAFSRVARARAAGELAVPSNA
jgi:hypothetical protein